MQKSKDAMDLSHQEPIDVPPPVAEEADDGVVVRRGAGAFPGSNNGGGRKATVIDIEQVEQHAARGLNLEAIAACLGFSSRTLHKYKKENSEVADAITRGRAIGEKAIANKLFELAKNGHVEAAKFYLARRCDWRETLNNEHAGKDGGAIQITISKDDAAL